MSKKSDAPETGAQRLDKWLWVARFFKSRSEAASAVTGGKVHVDQQRVKPAKQVRPGQMLDITRGAFHFEVRVVAKIGRAHV